MNWKLDSRIENDSIYILSLPLCDLRLKKDSENPWILLVPRRENIVEFTDLGAADRAQLWKEIEDLTSLMQSTFSSDKINIGALGNIVPQFHFHIICRNRSDRAWPNSIWGIPQKEKYNENVILNWKIEIEKKLKFV